MSSNVQRVRVRWFGNGSRRYDGKTEDVEVDAIIEEDRVGLAVGRTVRMPWGQYLLTATVEDLLRDPTPLELALPAKHQRKLPGTTNMYIVIVHDL